MVVSVHLQSQRISRAWYFGGTKDAPVFLCETETYHSPELVTSPAFNDGRQFYEYVELEYATTQSHIWAPGYRVTHFGRGGKEATSLEAAKEMGSRWGGLQVSAN